jgi:uncharacterized membrane protein YoaK (UPF0700 family)
MAAAGESSAADIVGANLGAEFGGGVPRHIVVRLLVVLAAAAGSLDVLCVARLGGPFASVVTGNLVQLGRGICAPDPLLALTSATAVVGYALGVAASTVALRGRPAGWRRPTSVLVMVEVALLAGVAVGWLATRGQPGGVAVCLMLALAGGAMGIQSGLTLNTGLRGASTTYFTGTLTDVVRGGLGGPRSRDAGDGRHTASARGYRPDRPGLVRLLALFLGALAGGLVLRVAPLWTPVLPLTLVAGAMAVAMLGCLRRR